VEAAAQVLQKSADLRRRVALPGSRGLGRQLSAARRATHIDPNEALHCE